MLELLYTLTFVVAAWIVIWICLVPLLFRCILQSVRFFAERCFQSKRTWGVVRLSAMCSSDVHDLYRLCDVWQSVDCCGIECCLCGGRLYGERMLRSSCTTKCQLFVLFRMVKRYSHSFFSFHLAFRSFSSAGLASSAQRCIFSRGIVAAVFTPFWIQAVRQRSAICGPLLKYVTAG